MIRALFLLVVGAGLWWTVATATRCRHHDEDGRSYLSWTYHRGRLRGQCQKCWRLTKGWDVPPPRAGFTPTARRATAAEVARLRWKRLAKSARENVRG